MVDASDEKVREELKEALGEESKAKEAEEKKKAEVSARRKVLEERIEKGEVDQSELEKRIRSSIKDDLRDLLSRMEEPGKLTKEMEIKKFLDQVEKRGRGISWEFEPGELKFSEREWNEVGLPNYKVGIHGQMPVFEGLEGYEELGRYWIDEPYVFVTILQNEETEELLYYVVEPLLNEREKKVVERIIGEVRGNLPPGEEEREKILSDRVVEEMKSYDIYLDPLSSRKILYYIIRNCIGRKKIDPLMKDPNIEDISCNGVGNPIFLYHSDYQNIPTNLKFESRDELDSFVVSLAESSGKSISYGDPTLDTTLPDGSRLQATLDEEVTTQGSSFTIRKFAEEPFTPTLLMKYGTYSADLLAYLWLAMESTKNMMIIGGTASGKTSTLNALALFLPPKTKVVSLEETRELSLYQDNWIPNVTREATEEHERSIDLYDLVEQSLRQRPEVLIVGEVRGEEGLPLFQAMSTGHSCYSTMHATTVQEAVNRLESDPIDVPHTMMEALDIVCFQVIARLNGRKVRRVKNVTEFLGLDTSTGDLDIDQVFGWDRDEDAVKRISESSIMEDIMDERGWDMRRLRQELEDRRMALEYLADNNVIRHDDFSRFMAKFYANPEATLEEIRAKRE